MTIKLYMGQCAFECPEFADIISVDSRCGTVSSTLSENTVDYACIIAMETEETALPHLFDWFAEKIMPYGCDFLLDSEKFGNICICTKGEIYYGTELIMGEMI